MKTQELCINGKKYEKGLGTYASSEIVYELKGDFARFESEVGLDDFAHELVPDHDRNRHRFRSPGVPIVDVHVRAADPRAQHLDKHVVDADLRHQ